MSTQLEVSAADAPGYQGQTVRSGSRASKVSWRTAAVCPAAGGKEVKVTEPPSLAAEKQAAVKLPEEKVNTRLPVLPAAGHGPSPPGKSVHAASARVARIQCAAMTTRMLVNIDVDDLEKGTRFYTEALGMRVGRRFGRVAVELLGAEAPVYLLVKEDGTAPFPDAPSRRDYRRHWTPVHLDFAVDDLDAAIRQATDAGARLEGAPSVHKWGKLAVFSDPFGHGLCLIQFLGRGYDEVVS
jgi:catechol 2,3-dioxygenase-like lactoylglutathione lyase family enzyme